MALNRAKVSQAAEKYLRQGKTEAAIQELRKLVNDNPRDVNTINRVGDLYARLGKAREAISQYSRTAKFYTDEGFFLKAIAIYKKITKLDPSYIEAYGALGNLYAQQGLVMEARAQHQIVAEHRQRAGDLERALESLREMQRLDPDDLKAHLGVAEMLEKLQRKAEALEEYRAVGEHLDRRGMHRESRRVYEAALRLNPSDNRLVRRLVLALRHQRASGEALPYLRGLLEKRPGDLELLSLVGDAHLDHGDVEQAREIFEQVRDKGPDRRENPLNQARLCLHNKDLAGCLGHLQAAVPAILEADEGGVLVPYVQELLDAEPHHLEALRLLADLHEGMEDMAAARDAWIRLAGASMEQGRLDSAAAALERLIRIDPDNPRHPERLQEVMSRMRRAGLSYTPAAKPAAPPDGGPAAAAPAAEPPAPEPREEASAEVPEEPAQEILAEPGVEVAADIEVAIAAGGGGETEEVDADFVAEHMTEAEVFVKYGLVDRAVEQIQQVLERYPGHLPAREALAAILREEGQRARAAEQYAAMAGIHRSRGDVERAEEMLRLRDAILPPGETPEPVAAEAPPPELPAVADRDAVEEETAEPAMEEAGAEETEIEIPAAEAAPPADRLEEVDVLLEGGALEEARRRLLALRAEFPDRSEVEERLARVAIQERQAVPAQPAAAQPGGEGFFDLAAELDAALFEPQAAMEPPEEEPHSLEDLVAAFKKGVQQQVSAEDFETHYNLAIAYKEMGLIDEAIGEFQFASKSTELLLKCCSMLGLCFREKGMHALAVKWYRRGIEAAGGGDEEDALGLRYDLAVLHQDSGEAGLARELFTEVYGLNAGYRDVAERIRILDASRAG